MIIQNVLGSIPKASYPTHTDFFIFIVTTTESYLLNIFSHSKLLALYISSNWAKNVTIMSKGMRLR